MTTDELQQIRERCEAVRRRYTEVAPSQSEQDRAYLFNLVIKQREALGKCEEVAECGRELMNYSKVVVLQRDPKNGLHNLANALNRFNATDQSALAAIAEMKKD